MAWLEDKAEDTELKEDNKWLKIPEPPAIGKTSEVKFRILDESPADVWRHWHDNRPYNCVGLERCPVCKVRNAALKEDREAAQKQYRTDHRYYFNVLYNGEVKIFSFSNSVGRKLQTFISKYGDLRDFDVSILKRKTGSLPMNVEYDVIYEGGKPLNDEEKYAAEARYDLSEYTKPASLDELRAVALGEAPEKPQEKEEGQLSKKATKADMITLKALVEAKGFTLGEFGIVETSPPMKIVVDKLIADLQNEK